MNLVHAAAVRKLATAMIFADFKAQFYWGKNWNGLDYLSDQRGRRCKGIP